MEPGGSVTHWLVQLQAGDAAAAQKIWESYFQKLVVLARRKLGTLPRRSADEEDVALSAFDSFCRGVERGRFPRLVDRDDLWHLLVVITARKAIDLRVHECRQKRGGGKVRDEAALDGDRPGDEAALAQVIGREPTPEFAAQALEECQRLLDRLPDAPLRSVAIAKMEGYTNDEIAAKLDCSTVTIERRLRLIRTIWQGEMEP